MAFIEHKPSRNSMSDEDSANIVRISFKIKQEATSKSTVALTIYIGTNIASRLGIKAGEKMSFLYDDENNRKWLLRKSENNSGYKLVDTGTSTNKTYLRLQLTLKLPNFKIDDKDLSARTIPHEVTQEGIIVNAN